MAPAVFGLAAQEPEVDESAPAAVAPATDVAAEAQAEPGDDGTDLGAEDLQDVDDDGSGHAEAVDQQDAGAEDLQAANEVGEAAAEEPGGAAKCAYCNIPFEGGDQLEEFNGKLYHAFCVEDGKRVAKEKQSKQIAIAA